MKTITCALVLLSSSAHGADVICNFEWPPQIYHHISITGKDVQWSSPRQYVEATATIRRNPIGTIWSFMVAPGFFISLATEENRKTVTIHKDNNQITAGCED